MVWMKTLLSSTSAIDYNILQSDELHLHVLHNKSNGTKSLDFQKNNIGFSAQFRQNCIQFNDTFIQFRANLNDLEDQHSEG